MGTFDSGIREALSRSSLLLAYLALVVGVIVGFIYLQNITERVELEAYIRSVENCSSVNESKMVLRSVLDALTEPRPDDLPGEYEERLVLRQAVDHLIVQVECPPLPDGAITQIPRR